MTDANQKLPCFETILGKSLLAVLPECTYDTVDGILDELQSRDADVVFFFIHIKDRSDLESALTEHEDEGCDISLTHIFVTEDKANLEPVRAKKELLDALSSNDWTTPAND